MDDLNQKCRLCSRNQGILIDIFDENGRAQNIQQKISSYLSLQIQEEDSLKTICFLCYGKLDNFHSFATNIYKIQEELSSVLQEGKPPMLPEEIKMDADITLPDDNIQVEIQDSGEINFSNTVEAKVELTSTRKSKLKRKIFTGVESSSKKNNCRVRMTPTNEDVAIQVGNSLSSDLANLREEINSKYSNLEGIEVVTFMPAPPISADTKTNKGCVAQINLGITNSKEKISSSTGMKLVKLPNRTKK